MKFVEYIEVNSATLLGIATVELQLGDPDLGTTPIFISFKETSGKNGNGQFIQCCAIKQGTGPDGKDIYKSDVIIDSNFAKDKLMAFIRTNINIWKQARSAQPAKILSISPGNYYPQIKEEQMDMPF